MARKKKDDAPEPEAPPAAQQAAVATLPLPSTNGTHEAKEQPLTEPKNGPTKCFRCPVQGGGIIEVAVWGKEIEVDRRKIQVYSITLHKSFKHEVSGDWKHTNYLRGSEIHVATRLMERAEAFILDQRTTEDPPF